MLFSSEDNNWHVDSKSNAGNVSILKDDGTTREADMVKTPHGGRQFFTTDGMSNSLKSLNYRPIPTRKSKYVCDGNLEQSKIETISDKSDSSKISQGPVALKILQEPDARNSSHKSDACKKDDKPDARNSSLKDRISSDAWKRLQTSDINHRNISSIEKRQTTSVVSGVSG